MRTMLLIWSFLALYALSDVHGRNVQIDWTLLGVANYRDPSNPLRIDLGDILTLRCENVSNLFIQAGIIQYTECNASAGSGQYDYSGFCLPSVPLMLTLTVNSQTLMNTINFENNRLYYFASYSNGELRDVNDQSIKSGGQCDDGLKMVVLIGENPNTPGTGGIEPGDPGGDDLNITHIAVIVVGGALVLVVFVCIICLCCCCKYKKGKQVKVNQKEPITTVTVNLEEPDVKIDIKPSKNGSSINQYENLKKPKTELNVVNNSKAVKSSPTTTASTCTSVHEKVASYQSQVNGRGGRNPTVGGKEKDYSPTQNGRHGEGLTIKPKMDAKAKINNKNAVASTDTTQTQIHPSKAMRNGNTTKNRTSAASSPSQISKASKGDKNAVHSGRTCHKGTVQSTAGSSTTSEEHNKPHNAPSAHNRPAPPPPSSAAMKHDRVQGKSSLPPAPTQSLPPSSTTAKHDRIQGKSSLRPVPTQSLPPSSTTAKHGIQMKSSLGEKTHDLDRTQKNTNRVSYKKNGAVHLA